MAASNGQFEIKACPILGHYNRQRFKQWSPEDAANWYLVNEQDTKQPYAMYPVLGRAHIRFLGVNQLVFGSEPRGLFKTVKYAYIVVGDEILRLDEQFNQVNITVTTQLLTSSGNLFFAFLVVGVHSYACFVDGQKIYIYQEDGTLGLQIVTDPLAPGNDGNGKPGYIAAFGNRITVSIAESSEFVLSAINLAGTGASNPAGIDFDPAKVFTNAVTPQVFAQEDGFIRQMGVLNNTLYIFTDYITGVWSNNPAVFSGTGTTFPWKKSSTYNWNFGIANPTSLDVNFGYMAWLARNSDGLIQFMVSSGDVPQRFSDKAIDTMLQDYTNRLYGNNPFLSLKSNGFLYQYENTIFYRMSGGPYTGTGILDQEMNANSIQFSFETKSWHRCIEYNGERSRVQQHIFFSFRHLVSVLGDSTVYDMSGKYYYNESRNPDQPDSQETDAYIAYPFRYERTTPIIADTDYSEFETEFVQIDMVWGDSNINYSTGPFRNAVFIIDEEAGSDSQPQFLVTDQEGPDSDVQYIIAQEGNTPQLDENFYNALYKPSIELYWSDDGGVSFYPADMREFSQSGVYNWRMRWYQLGTSRNRVYKLVAVSPVPIVILGATMNVRRISGGAY